MQNPITANNSTHPFSHKKEADLQYFITTPSIITSIHAFIDFENFNILKKKSLAFP